MIFTASAQADQLFQQAHQAYQEQRYADAVAHYEALVAEGYRSDALYYNLGNAYFRMGAVGKAVLNYERAIKISPGDKQTIQNLEVVRRQLQDDLLTVPESAIVRQWRSLQGVLASDTWAGIGLALFWLGVGGITVWLLHRVRRFKKAGFFAGWIFLSLSILPFLLAYGRAQEEAGQEEAVIMVEKTMLRAAPEMSSQEVMLLHEGTKIRLMDAIGKWYLVRLSDTSEGWLPRDVVERI